jgi:ribosome-associated translation inhibitor RaiA
MKLVNVTNSYKQLVNKQLENTDAYFVKVYSAGNTTVVYSEAAQHVEILIINKKRAVRKTEINEIVAKLLRRIPKEAYDKNTISLIELKDATEISIPLKTTLANL